MTAVKMKNLLPDLLLVLVSGCFSAVHLFRLFRGEYPDTFERVIVGLIVLFTAYVIWKFFKKIG